jgi:hypothetical protein
MPLGEVVSFLRRLGLEAAFPVTLFLVFSLTDSFHPIAFLLLLMLCALVLLAWLAIIVLRIVVALWEREWSNAAFIGAGVGLAALLALPILRAGDYVHLAVMYPYYEYRVAASNGDRMIFDWGADGMAGNSTDYFLVYDRSGDLQKTGTLQLSAGAPELPVFVRHLIGSFYLAAYS